MLSLNSKLYPGWLAKKVGSIVIVGSTIAESIGESPGSCLPSTDPVAVSSMKNEPGMTANCMWLNDSAWRRGMPFPSGAPPAEQTLANPKALKIGALLPKYAWLLAPPNGGYSQNSRTQQWNDPLDIVRAGHCHAVGNGRCSSDDESAVGAPACPQFQIVCCNRSPADCAANRITN